MQKQTPNKTNNIIQKNLASNSVAKPAMTNSSMSNSHTSNYYKKESSMIAMTNASSLDANNTNKIVKFKAALIQQKSKLKKSSPPNSKKLNDYSKLMISSSTHDNNNNNNNNVDDLFNYDQYIQSKLEALPVTGLKVSKSNTVNNSSSKKTNSHGQSAGNSLIISRQGTVRGNVNPVKTSLKQIFKDPNVTSNQSSNNQAVQLNINNNSFNLANIVNAKVNIEKPIFYNHLVVLILCPFIIIINFRILIFSFQYRETMRKKRVKK